MKLEAQYNPKETEKTLYDFWLDHHVFDAPVDSKKPKYCIVLPPPNVTGVLHMGHALTVTLEDILIRHKRMQGYNALWVPGTDHAGIATQMVVERNLMRDEKKSRHDLGREKFLEKVWEWKKASETTIHSQLKVMGCSLDWSRLAFTMDESVSKAVRECFFRLYQDKLIYREEAIIQWCPRCHTALSDLEVKFKDVKGKFWSLRYRLKDDPTKYIVVATTRPETLLGDTAIAVHPDDERYKAFQGKKVLLPLLNREIPVIADTYVDPAFGTGALKITPGHDPNDYAVGKRHGLPLISIFDESAVVNEHGKIYQGLKREKAREKILEDLKTQDLFESEKDHQHSVGHCDRCGTVVEPKVSQQWFVKAEVLAKPAIEAVEKKEIKIVPEEWEKTYFEWMRNIRPWCISRQLWWGHRIPVWYCLKCDHYNVAVETPTACEKCKHPELRQEEDVLDTWFSSGLWPFSTLGWPQETPDFKTFYPNDVLETGFDILFFWVARMIMLGHRMTGKFPFHTVYLHPMVRDEYGQKMSKSKGNVVDPLEIVERMGTDSLRFFLAWNAYQGRDLRVSDDGVEGCRNFVSKVWNASRFVLMHFEEIENGKSNTQDPVNQWILFRLNETKLKVKTALENYRFFEAAQALYHFVWNDYCDWYLELCKTDIEERKSRKDTTAVLVLEESLRLLHPFMPFVTEKIWQALPLRDTSKLSIALAAYPEPSPVSAYEANAARIDQLIAVVEKVRTLKGTHGISPAKEMPLALSANGQDAILNEMKSLESLLKKLSRASEIQFLTSEPSKQTHVALILKDLKVFVPKSELGDLTKEIERKKKELADKTEALKRAEEKLKNEKFMSSAPEAVRAGVVKNREDLSREVQALSQYLEDMS